ncbi:hypothetical protein AOC36_07475 [Erysipelothrix larvae]|uniref:Squalene cyclase C-terminal domain-containing protein n=1 Tax=Erysipelothrix larvae TaxID=1514105 RepID=A0A0X8H0N3_9FIRM|nr:hypothetical protein [Erysipelothrix larvae]AMC93829.1 hypothetical protein AOC36_07475 [Erysipelothrix larvae]
MITPYEKTKDFVYRNARPLDIARWRYHFEYGALSHVLKGLSHYQNDDGGFGHALEPDSRNPNSTPIQTWLAAEILREINFDDGSHPIIQGILMYLDSGQDFDGYYWANTVQTNNDYPHAVWWHNHHGSNNDTANPTAALVGFILKYANPHSSLYQKAKEIAIEVVQSLFQNNEETEMHVLLCYIRLYESLIESKTVGLVDMEAFKTILLSSVQKSITHDTTQWGVAYITKPSQFIRCPHSIFYPQNKDIIDFECKFILNTQQDDGSWNIPWQWDAYPEQWAISKNWWAVNMCIENISLLRNFDKL